MRFPFVTISHHEDIVSELRSQLAEKDAERRKYIDLLGQLGFGRKILESESTILDEEEPIATSAQAPARRPSDIVKAQNMKALREHEEKNGKRRREQVLEMVRLAADPGNPQVTQ